MKQLLPLLALMMLLKSLYPIVEYIANYEYIVEYLCENKDKPQLKCNGKCHLSKELMAESKKSLENPFNNKKVKFEFPIINSLIEEETPILFCFVFKNNYQQHSNFITNLFVVDILHPPQIS